MHAVDCIFRTGDKGETAMFIQTAKHKLAPPYQEHGIFVEQHERSSSKMNGNVA